LSRASFADKKGKRGSMTLLKYVGIIALIVLVLFPFLWLLQMSFKPAKEIFSFPPTLFFNPTLDNYLGLWSAQFQKSFANSAITAVTTTVLSLALGVPAAYALSRARLRSESKISLWILATRMAPPIAFTIPFFLAYREVGLQDSLAGLILVYLTFNLSLVVWMMRVFFDSIPSAIEEAAYIDGSSVWGAFFRVTLPLSAPGLAATAIFCFLFSWNDFFYALILTRTQAMTAPVAVANFMQYSGWEWGKIAAGGTMVMLPVVVFSLLVRNYLVRGLTSGAVKG
jgi:multiple sugar transport system permease protein